jgi:hypothetical protein|eukprot:COSAG06_NODE_16345_length_1006_cov_0.891951_2_plen_90_part_00
MRDSERGTKPFITDMSTLHTAGTWLITELEDDTQSGCFRASFYQWFGNWLDQISEHRERRRLVWRWPPQQLPAHAATQVLGAPPPAGAR